MRLGVRLGEMRYSLEWAISGEQRVDHIEALLKLPFEILALVSAGYLSLRIAYLGQDGKARHDCCDVLDIRIRVFD